MARNFFTGLVFVCALCIMTTADDAKPEAPQKPKIQAKQVKPAKVKVKAVAAIQIGGFGNRVGLATRVREDVERNDNVERFVLLAPRGPIVVEAEIMLDGKPFRNAREKLVDEMLKAADTNGDGKSTWKEALDNPQFLFGRTTAQLILPVQIKNNQIQPKKPAKEKAKEDQEKKEKADDKKPAEKKDEKKNVQVPQVQIRILQLGNQAQNAADREALIRQIDSNKNGLVDRSEARLLLAQTSGGPAFSVSSSYNRLRVPDVKSVLDSDNDGKLSKKEIAASAERLKSRDANGNDLVEAAELGSNGGLRNVNGQVIMVRAFGGLQANQSAVGHLLGPAADSDALYEALQKKYGDKDGKITAEKFTLFPMLFEQLDTNKNGQLDADEVKGLDSVKPHVQLQANLGETKPAGISVKSIAKELGNEKAVQNKFSNEVALTLSDVKIRFAASPSPVRRVNYDQIAQKSVERFDTNKNGYIELKEMEKVNAILKQQFDRWDTNSDGKVYADEIKAAYHRQQAPMQSRVAASVGEQGPSLFSTLDVSGDKRLSSREMKTAPQQLLSKDKNKDGEIGLDEIPIEIQVALNQGNANAGRVFLTNAGQRPATRSNPNQPKGPDWFTRMDRNGDGDVTLREFLGSDEQFKKIDTNGDGFIELKEAEAAKLPGLKKDDSK